MVLFAWICGFGVMLATVADAAALKGEQNEPVVKGQPASIVLQHFESVQRLAFNQRGDLLGVNHYPYFSLWDMKRIASTRSFKSHCSCARLSPDGGRLALQRKRVIAIVDRISTRVLHAWILPTHAYLECVAFNHDGTRVAVAINYFIPIGRHIPNVIRSMSPPGYVQVWDLITGLELWTGRGHLKQVTEVVFGPDSKQVVSCDLAGVVKIWDARTGCELRSIRAPDRGVRSIAISPDGKRLVGGSATAKGCGRVIIWDLATGRQLLVLDGNTGVIESVAISPDGKQIASGSYDAPIRLWDTTTGRLVAILSGHEEPITSLAYSPDGKTLASGSADQTVRLWFISGITGKKP